MDTSVREQLESLNSLLLKMKSTIRKLNIKAAQFDIDVISLHDPAKQKQMEERKQLCMNCYETCSTRMYNYSFENENKNKLEVQVMNCTEE